LYRLVSLFCGFFDTFCRDTPKTLLIALADFSSSISSFALSVEIGFLGGAIRLIGGGTGFRIGGIFGGGGLLGFELGGSGI
jgi:hypothetical protein